MTTLKTEDGGVQEDLGTVRKRELAIAKIFTLLFILKRFTILNVLGGRANHPLPCNRKGVWGSSKEAKEGGEGIPLGNVEVLRVREVRGQMSDVDGGLISDRWHGRSASLLVNSSKRVSELAELSLFERGKIRSIASGNFADLTEGGDGTANNTASLRVADGGLDLQQTRKELRQERTDGDRRVNKLGHVVDDAVENLSELSSQSAKKN